MPELNSLPPGPPPRPPSSLSSTPPSCPTTSAWIPCVPLPQMRILTLLLPEQVRLPQTRPLQLHTLEPSRPILNLTKIHPVDKLPMLTLPHLENRRGID